MRSNTTFKSIISGILLIYFAFFIVPPVSCFSSSQNQPHEANDFQQYGSVVQDKDHAPLFLFDIIAWQEVRKARHSKIIESPDSTSVNDDYDGFSDINQITRVNYRSDSLCRQIPITLSPQSRSSDARFKRSGISPPMFFS